jgi:membrane fusion protein (multidrug efflux system)
MNGDQEQNTIQDSQDFSMRTASRFAIVIVFLALVLGGIFGYKFYQIGQMQEKFSQPQPPATIEAVEARKGTWQRSLKSVGSIKAVNGVRIANEVPGVAKEIQFESAQRVKKGQVLLRMDTATDEAALSTRRAEARLAEQAFNRISDLLPKNAVSQSQYDEAQANLEVARARVNEAEAQLDKKILEAPFAGMLGIRLIDQGEYLPAGTPIVEINTLDPIYADYAISEKELAHIEVGHKVRVTVVAAPDKSFPGEVTAINSSVNPESRTVRVRATLDNPDRQLQPGMFATIATVRPTQREVVYVPRTAISFNTYGDYVYVVQKNDKGQKVVERRSVETGPVEDGNVAVTKNLDAGEQVVATGLLRLRAGQPVQFASESNKQGQEKEGNKNGDQQSAPQQGGQ